MYLALYRKYRPKTFDMVIGQNHITTTLKNQIVSGNISHAYLFCGTRGTGKTSVAKIFAQSINCEHPNGGNPCGKCKTCLEMQELNNVDILEIDAASNNRVDEIRELREKVKYPPVNGKYKVYIIDEVHMLTDSAFNALLKTLEEPPAHVVFILATTEVQKLPATILSRVLRFDFKLVSVADLVENLKYIFKDSGIKYEEEALTLIASLGEGSVRDTQSIADMVVAYSNKNVTYQAVLDAVGAIDKNTLFSLGNAILNKDASGVIENINTIVKLGKSVTQIAKDLSNYYRDLAVIKTTNEYADILSYPKNLLDNLVSSAKKYNADDILRALKAFSSLENEFRQTTNPRLLIEVTALNLVSEYAQTDLLTRIEKLESGEGIKKPNKTADLNSANPQLVKVVELFSDDYSAPITVTQTRDESVAKIKMQELNEHSADLDVFNTMGGSKKSDTAQVVFGKILIKLRELNEFSLHSLLGNNITFEISEQNAIITLNDQVKYDVLKKEKNIVLLNSVLSDLDTNLTVLLQYNPSISGASDQITSKLMRLFGNKLIIEE